LDNIPQKFEFKERVITPFDFWENNALDLQNYVSITSFSHHPFYSNFVLEIPDNFSGGEFYNVPLDNLVEMIDSALLKGFTLIWDGDVSEPTFSTKKKGIAMLPERNEKGELIRQVQFERLQTTDDHLMHCVGFAISKNGTKYYIMKNSWGKVGPYDGYTYMSETYLKMKTISIMVNKNGLTKEIKNRIDGI
jgi:bleomycin hydrolase